jgi:hypothetical protein
MVYTLIGKAVIKALRVLLRQRYGPALTPKPVLGVLAVGTVVGVAVAATRRSRSA